jgi:hypothetical protein
LAVLRFGTANSIDGDNVGVLELAGRTRLALEALDEVQVDAERGGQHLDGHFAVEGLLAGAIDYGHAPAPQLLEHIVIALERGADDFYLAGRARWVGGAQLVRGKRRHRRQRKGLLRRDLSQDGPRLVFE